MVNFIGQSLGRYHILEQLGEGGMATVYKAHDTHLETEVAVKVIRTDALPQVAVVKTLKRFEQEAKVVARLTHPNIVKVMDYGEQAGQPFLVMPLLPGGTLKQRLGQRIPWPEAARILLPIAEALDYAHNRGMIHRDVKPSNILLTERGQPMLSDFGIAKILDTEVTMELTGSSVALGTPEYMAPEQATARAADHRADIYALGIVLYEMITGKKPYTADTPMAVLIMHARDPLPSPRKLVPNLPSEVEKILLKALAKNPQDRYQSMIEVIQSFEKVLMTGKAGSVEAKKSVVKDRTRRPLVPPEEHASTGMESSPELQRRTRLWRVLPVAALVVGGILLVAMVGLRLNLMNRVSSPTRQIPEQPTAEVTASASAESSPSAVILDPIMPPAVITDTPVAAFTSTPAGSSDRILLYKAKGSRGLEHFFFLNLTTGQKWQVASNPGFTISSEQVSDDGRFLAFCFSYGSEQTKLGILDLTTSELMQLSNELEIAHAQQFDWLPDNLLLFLNDDTEYVELFDPMQAEAKILATGRWYSLSPDRTAIMIGDLGGTLHTGSLNGMNTTLKQVVTDEKPTLNGLRSDSILWAPDNRAFAVRTGEYYWEDNYNLTLWSLDGQQDKRLALESKDWLSFSWGRTADEYAYIVGEGKDSVLTQTLFFQDKSLPLPAEYGQGVRILPDGNLIVGNYWGEADYLVDRDSLNLEEFPAPGYNVQFISSESMILYLSGSEGAKSILADRDGLHDLGFSPAGWGSWDWAWTAGELWVRWGDQIINTSTHEIVSLALPEGATVIDWEFGISYSSISALPTVSSSSPGFFTCTVSDVVGERLVTRRTCSCTETECSCIDYLWARPSVNWTRSRRGVESYFADLGGQCYFPTP